VTTVPISPGSSGEEGLWRTALEVAALFRDWPWVIIGAQMVMLLELEHGRPSGRTTSDLDAMVDVRVVVDAMRLGAERLIDAGFESSAEHRFRFVRGLDQVDLLVPDHVGRRVDLATISSEATAGIPGGRRALATRRFIDSDWACAPRTNTEPAWQHRRTQKEGHRAGAPLNCPTNSS
jgi:hypothetical protein